MKFAKVLAVLLTSLTLACAEERPGPNIVASYSGGEVNIQAVELQLRELGETLDQADRKGLIQAYRDVAQRIVVGQAFLELATPTQRDSEIQESARREVIIELFKSERLVEVEPVSIQSIEDFYQEHEEDFHRKPRRFVWHIFRRHQDQAHPEITMAELATIKESVLAGESFENLAREHSHSETRLNGGRLGWMGRDRLPQSIEEAVFSLEKDEISAPLPVPGGGAIFMVSEVIRDAQVNLDDVRLLIHQRLLGDALRQRARDIIGDTSVPEGSVVFNQEEFQRAINKATPEDILLELADYKVTAGMLWNLVLEKDPQVFDLPFLAPDRWRIYSDLVLDQRLYLHAVETGFPVEAGPAAEIERRVRLRTEAAIIDRSIDEAMRLKMTENHQAIEAFFQANRFNYQSPLRFKLWSLSLPVGKDNDQRVAALESIRAQIEDGNTDLTTAAAKAGADLVDMGWMDVASLQQLAPKLGHYVLDLKGGGTSIPFQLNRRLNIVHVEKREEPKQLPFVEVEDRVYEDYLERHKQQLYSQIEVDVLRDVRFRFHEEAVRLALQ